MVDAAHGLEDLLVDFQISTLERIICQACYCAFYKGTRSSIVSREVPGQLLKQAPKIIIFRRRGQRIDTHFSTSFEGISLAMTLRQLFKLSSKCPEKIEQ
jgi:hypothetical protein